MRKVGPKKKKRFDRIEKRFGQVTKYIISFHKMRKNEKKKKKMPWRF